MRKIVFNADKWNHHDIGTNEQFWEEADVEIDLFGETGTVTWADGSVTKGHYINGMRDLL